MDWIQARALNDGQYLLEQLLSQIASDVHAINRLPGSVRRQFE